MKRRTFARIGKGVFFGLLLIAAVSPGIFSEPTTYGGVTFPNGDLSFADRVVDYVAASCVRDAYDDPEEALGPPDACPAGCEGCFGCDTNAVALGFRLSRIDDRGYLIIEFVDNILVDEPGPDLFIYITNNKPCIVEISEDGYSWIHVGETVGYPGAIDIGPYVPGGGEFRYVRVTDVPADEDHSRCPGSSIDAIGAMGPAIEIGTGEAFGSLELQPIGELAFAFDFTPNSYYIILDTSGSMDDVLDGDKKIDIAKSVIIDLLNDLPTEALVGMRTFGGCGHSDLIYGIEQLNRAALRQEVLDIVPHGATPIAFALDRAKEDLADIRDAKMLLLITDGGENCDGDPLASAQAIIDAGYDFMIHVVGFDIGADPKAREQLLEIARSTGGVYFDAESSDELRQALSLVAPFSYVVYDEAGNEVFEGRLGDPGPSLAAGTYTVVIATTPPTTLTGVVVEDQSTTTITVEQSNGGYKAAIE